MDELTLKGKISRRQIRLLTRDGIEHRYFYSAMAVKDEAGSIIFIDDILTDADPGNEIETKIQKDEQLRAIGDLAGGIAHHFNNIMTGLFGNLSLAQMELKDSGSQALRYLDAARNSMHKGMMLTRQLLTFAKGGHPVKEPTDLVSLIRDAAGFVLSGSDIHFGITFDDGLWPFLADRSQLNQVISNIVLNSRQAVAHGGGIKIHIENAHFVKDNLLIVSTARYLKVIITDNGCGIPQKNLKRIFDPYFTTRPNGTGMGLSICHSIIQKHDGHIFITSALNQGTTITIYLPANLSDAQKEKAMQPDHTDSQSQNITILVMDDEKHIQILLQKMLEKFGYHVEATADGQEAVDRYTALLKANRPPDLVIMDLTVPGKMGGQEAAKKILAMDTDARIIVSSGYANDPVMSDYKSFGLIGIIPKPYRMAELKAKIEGFLSEPK